MFTRATALPPVELKSAIVRDPLVVSPNMTVLATITQMSNAQSISNAAKTTDRSLDALQLEARSSCVVVVEDGQVVGILTERDVVRLSAQQQPLNCLVMAQVMAYPVVTLREAAFTDLFCAINLLQRHHIRHLPILDQQDRLVGLVTHESLQQAFNPSELYKLAKFLEKEVVRLEADQVIKVERQKLVAQIASRIRTSFNLQEILNICVTEVRTFLACDRVLVYQFQSNWSGSIIAESVDHGWLAALGNQINDAYFQQKITTLHDSEQAIVVNNIYTAGYTDCYIKLLEQYQVKANLVVPIRVMGQLWGLLIGHQCADYRDWRTDDKTLFQDLSVQLAIALQQATAWQQAQTELEERKKAEAELEQAFARLQKSEQRYATLAAAPVGIFRTDVAGRCLYVNDRWRQIAGLPSEAAAGEGWRQGLHLDDRDRVTAEWRKSVQEHRSLQLEYRFQHPDGTSTWVYEQAVAERDTDGQVIGYVGAITDISDRKRAELALAQSEAQNRAILAAIPDLIFLVGADGVYRRLFNRDLDILPQAVDYIGQYIADVLPAELAERQLHYLQQALQTDELQVYEQRIQVGDRCQDEEVRLIKSSKNEVLFMIRDISDRKQAEAHLQKLIAGTAATIGQDFFPALVSHIAATLNVSYALVTEQVNDELQALAFWANGALQSPLHYHPAKTPCELTLQDGKFYCEHSVQQRFPDDLDLVKMKAESYLGIVLRNTQGKAIGDLCILNQQPIPDPQRAENLLCVLAARAAVELERQRASTLLKQLNQALEAKVEERTAELQEREQFLQTVLDTFPLSVFWKNRDSVFLGCNRNFLRDAGLKSVSDILGKTDYDMPWGKTEADAYRADDRQVMDSDTAKLGIIATQIQADGDPIWLETNKLPLHNLMGEVMGVLGTYQDISDRKRAEEDLRASEARLQLITDSVHGCISYIDASERYRFVNRTYEEWFSCRQRDILGRTTEEVMGTQAYHRARQYIKRVLSGETVAYEAELPYKGGHTRYVSAVLVPDIDSQARVQGYYALITDISDRKRAEAQIRQYTAQLEVSNRELEAFAYSVSHDLRAPLRAINGFSKALLEEYGDSFDEKGKDYFDRIRKNVTRMGLLIDDLLSLSRVSSSEIRYTTVNLSTLAQELMNELQASEPERQVKFVMAPEVVVSADATLMRVVLTNLFDNAWKFTRRHPTPCIEFGVIHQVRRLTYFVRDDGVGFNMAYSKKLFGAFQRLHTVHEFPGTGIGLATVQRAIHRHGGNIWAEGAVGRGATFYFTLPHTLSS